MSQWTPFLLAVGLFSMLQSGRSSVRGNRLLTHGAELGRMLTGCAAEAEFQLILDYSGSMKPADRTNQKAFARDFVNALTLGNTASRVGITQFATRALLKLSLSAQKAQIIAAIDSDYSEGTSTNIQQALIVSSSNLESASRSKASKTIILLTDGSASKSSGTLNNCDTKSSHSERASCTADFIHSSRGTTIIAVGIGNVRGLDKYARPEGSDNIITSSSSDDLLKKVNDLIQTACPTDCSWKSWSSWGSCSSGKRTRSRTKASVAANGGAACAGSSTDEESCSDCAWKSWSSWGSCSSGSVRVRAQQPPSRQTEERRVQAAAQMKRAAVIVLGKAGAVGEVAVQGSVRVRARKPPSRQTEERRVQAAAQMKRAAVIVLGKAGAVGEVAVQGSVRVRAQQPPSRQTEERRVQAAVQMKRAAVIVLGKAGAVGEVAVQGSVRVRAKASVAANGGAACAGSSTDEESCSDCAWKSWSSWGSCSSGKRTRSRTKASVAANGGAECQGSGDEAQQCIDCEWSWQAWSTCSASGSRARSLKVSRAALNGGTPCPSSEDETQNDSCQNCVVTSWGAWAACTHERPRKRRTRSVIRLPSSNGGEPCPSLEEDGGQCDFSKEVCYSACAVRGYGESSVDIIAGETMRPVARWPSDHPSLPASCAGSVNAGELLPQAGKGACRNASAAELFYNRDPSTGDANSGLHSASSADSKFYFVVDENGGTYFVGQMSGKQSGVRKSFSTIVDIRIASSLDADFSPSVLVQDDPEDKLACIQGQDGSVCTGWRFYQQWSKEAVGDGFVLGKFPSHSFCLDLQIAEAAGLADAVSFVPERNAFKTIDLPINILQKGGLRFCAHSCRGLNEAPSCVPGPLHSDSGGETESSTSEGYGEEGKNPFLDRPGSSDTQGQDGTLTKSSSSNSRTSSSSSSSSNPTAGIDDKNKEGISMPMLIAIIGGGSLYYCVGNFCMVTRVSQTQRRKALLCGIGDARLPKFRADDHNIQQLLQQRRRCRKQCRVCWKW